MSLAADAAAARGQIAGGIRRLKWLAAAAGFQLALHRHAYALKANFNPNQPRVPAGNPDGGQWTSGGGGEASREARVVISDETPGPWIADQQYAQSGPRGPYTGRGPILINGQWVQPTPAQSAILVAVEARADTAIRRVQEIFPSWRPTGSFYDTVEGRIARARAEAEQAETRIAEFQRNGILPGLFARESIPARGPERNFYVSERLQNNYNGSTFGCHTCGTFNPGTRSGNFFCDHQMPSALNSLGRPQRIYPHCASCSWRQGGMIKWYREKFK